MEIWCNYLILKDSFLLKKISQRYPRLYTNISNVDDVSYQVTYYDNKYKNNGEKIHQTMLISRHDINKTIDVEIQSDSIQKGELLKVLYSLNYIEFELLKKLIKKQKKVVEIYLNNDKRDQYRMVKSSLELLYDYKEEFNSWFLSNPNYSNS